MSETRNQEAGRAGLRAAAPGGLAGLSAGQAVVCLAGGLTAVGLFVAGRRGPGAVVASAAAVVIAAVSVPIRGRPAARWVSDAVCHHLARRRGDAVLWLPRAGSTGGAGHVGRRRGDEGVRVGE